METIVGLSPATENRILTILERGRFDVNDSATHITYSSEHTDHDMDCYFGTQYEYLDLTIKYQRRGGIKVFVFYEVTYETYISVQYDYHIDNIETHNYDLLRRVTEIIDYHHERKCVVG